MLKKGAACLRDAQEDDSVRVVTVTGAGGAFCAGVDLDDFEAEGGTPYADKQLHFEKAHQGARGVEAFGKRRPRPSPPGVIKRAVVHGRS